jgi:membrane-bound inhibitor of C-type lysozyme
VSLASQAQQEWKARRLHTGLGVLGLLSVLACTGMVEQAPAQSLVTFHSFHCGDGTDFVAAFYQGTRSAYVQIDGKAMTLPRRLSLSGARYSGGGITVRIKGDAATLSRGRQSTDCASS